MPVLSLLDLGSLFQQDLDIEGQHLDLAQVSATKLLSEMFPLEAELLLSDWERVFSISPDPSSTLDERRFAVLSHDRATGGLTLSYYEELARGLGFRIGTHVTVGDPHLRISEADYPAFRADYGRADIDAVFDQLSGSSQYTWRVFGTSVSSNLSLQVLFNRLKPAWTEVIFIDE